MRSQIFDSQGSTSTSTIINYWLYYVIIGGFLLTNRFYFKPFQQIHSPAWLLLWRACMNQANVWYWGLTYMLLTSTIFYAATRHINLGSEVLLNSDKLKSESPLILMLKWTYIVYLPTPYDVQIGWCIFILWYSHLFMSYGVNIFHLMLTTSFELVWCHL